MYLGILPACGFYRPVQGFVIKRQRLGAKLCLNSNYVTIDSVTDRSSHYSNQMNHLQLVRKHQ